MPGVREGAKIMTDQERDLLEWIQVKGNVDKLFITLARGSKLAESQEELQNTFAFTNLAEKAHASTIPPVLINLDTHRRFLCQHCKQTLGYTEISAKIVFLDPSRVLKSSRQGGSRLAYCNSCGDSRWAPAS